MPEVADGATDVIPLDAAPINRLWLVTVIPVKVPAPSYLAIPAAFKFIALLVAIKASSKLFHVPMYFHMTRYTKYLSICYFKFQFRKFVIGFDMMNMQSIRFLTYFTFFPLKL